MRTKKKNVKNASSASSETPKKPAYPTSEEIEEEMTKIRLLDESVTLLTDWRLKTWNKIGSDTVARYVAIVKLLKELNRAERGENITVVIKHKNPEGPQYDTEKSVLYLTNVSVISALHEFAHHIYGKSELDACAWSLKLFKTAFPKAWDKLSWKGHLRVRKTTV